VWVLVSSGAATVEVVGEFGGFSTVGEYFNVQTATLDMHIRWGELAAIFGVEKPGHMNGPTTYSLQFFDRTGAAAFKVFLNFGETTPPDRLLLFRRLVETYRRPGASADGQGSPDRGE
jgi:putative heme iron utilization protein